MSRLLFTNYVGHRKCQASIRKEKLFVLSLFFNSDTGTHAHTHTRTGAYLCTNTHRGQKCCLLSDSRFVVTGVMEKRPGNLTKTDGEISLSFLQSSRALIRAGILICQVKTNASRPCWQAQDNLNGLLLQWQKQHQSADVSYRHHFLMDPWPNSFYGKTGHTLCLSV